MRRQIQYLTDAFVARSQEALARRFTAGDPKLPRTFFTRDCVKPPALVRGGRRALQLGGGLVPGDCQPDRRPGRGAAVRLRGGNGEPGRSCWPRCAPTFGVTNCCGGACRPRPSSATMTRGWTIPARRLSASPGSNCWPTRPRAAGRYLPSCILFVTYYGAGLQVGATPDGRRGEEVLTDSVGPAQGRDRHGPTAMLNSVSKLPLQPGRRHAGPEHPLHEGAAWRKSDSLAKVVQLIRAFFAGRHADPGLRARPGRAAGGASASRRSTVTSSCAWAATANTSRT